MLQFTFQLALLTDVGAASVLFAEVEAHLALGEYDQALAIAQGALLKEDRLEGLAAIVHAVKKKGERPDPALLAEIENLVPDIDYSAAPNPAVSIASAIITTLPDAAIRLVESATKGDSDYPLDAAYATLTLAARDLEREQAESSVTEESLSSRITNPSIRTAARALSVVVAGYSVDELLRRCEQMESTRDCLYLLERWAANNTEHGEAHKVLNYGLGRMVRATDYTVDAKTVRRIASPLPHIAARNDLDANTLLRMIDAHLLMLEKNGPSVDYVRLCISLAETEAAWSQDASISRFEQLGYFVANLEPDLRVEALGWMIAVLKLNRYRRLDDVISTFLGTFEHDFGVAVDQLLLGTAEHYEVLKGVVRVLAFADRRLTMEVAAKANTRQRRDALVAEALSQLTMQDLRVVPPDEVRAC